MIDTDKFDPEYREKLVNTFGKELFHRYNTPEYATYYDMLVRRYNTSFANCCKDVCMNIVYTVADYDGF